MIPSEIPSRPWQTVRVDVYYVQQLWFLIVVKHYSKFPLVKKLHNLTTGATVNEMKMLFIENGIPKSLQYDNGTQFTSDEFQLLASQYGFEIVPSINGSNLSFPTENSLCVLMIMILTLYL